jgi:hypothetical protein
MWEEREDYSWIHWFQEVPVLLIDRVEHAAKQISGYAYRRDSDTEIVIYRHHEGLLGHFEDPDALLAEAALDLLAISATKDEIGTRLEMSGRSEPEVIHAMRQALDSAR